MDVNNEIIHVQDTEAKKTHFASRRIWYLSVGVLTLLVLATVAYAYRVPLGVWANRHLSMDKSNSNVTVSSRPFNPSGTIYLSLSAQTDTSTNGIYGYNTQTSTLQPYFFSKGTLSVGISFPSSFSSNVLLATNARTATGGSKSKFIQLAIYSPTTASVTPITNSSLEFKRQPLWAEGIKAELYDAESATATVLRAPDDFAVYAHHASGADTEVTLGALPALTPDGKSVVVLRNDGLHLVSLVGTSTASIWPVRNGSAAINQQFAISPKGDQIAWSVPQDGKIYLMSVQSWFPFVGQVVKSIPTHAFWPTFSPDEQYLAFEEVDWGSTPTNPRLVIQDLVSPQRKSVYDLSGFLQGRMFINAWND